MDNLWITMPVLITTAVIICILIILYRLMYIRAYKAGASKVLQEWKLSLEEEFNNDEQI